MTGLFGARRARAVERVIVLDDFATAARLRGRACERAGKTPFVTTSPEIALAIARRERPDTAILDIFLNHPMTGIDVARELKLIDPQIYVVVVSVQLDAELAALAMQHGADDCLPAEMKCDEIIDGIEKGYRPTLADDRYGNYRTLDEIERAYLLRVFRDHDENVTRTAEALGLTRQTVQKKFRKYGIVPVSRTPIPRKPRARASRAGKVR